MDVIDEFCQTQGTCFRTWLEYRQFETTDGRIFEINYHDSGNIMGIHLVS